MYVELRCSKCGETSLVSFSTLYGLWKEGYGQMEPQYQQKAIAVTDVRCHCGHKERYDGPMFQYIFQLIFDELVREEEV